MGQGGMNAKKCRSYTIVWHKWCIVHLECTNIDFYGFTHFVIQMIHFTPWNRFLFNVAFYTLKSYFSSNCRNYTLNLQLTCAQKCRFYTLKLNFCNLTESWRAGHFHCVFWSFLLESAPPKITWPNCNAQHVFPFDFCHLPLNRPLKNRPKIVRLK